MYVGGLSVEHWVNDALMAVFFLLIDLELEREMYNGEPEKWRMKHATLFSSLRFADSGSLLNRHQLSSYQTKGPIHCCCQFFAMCHYSHGNPHFLIEGQEELEHALSSLRIEVACRFIG
jgi:hypothetical protein